MQELTKPITGYGSLAKANADFPTDSEETKWEDPSLQRDITEHIKATMFFEKKVTAQYDPSFDLVDTRVFTVIVCHDSCRRVASTMVVRPRTQICLVVRVTNTSCRLLATVCTLRCCCTC